MGRGLLQSAPATPPADTVGETRAVDESERRRQLISAAEQVFVAKGYVATTMADIAATASMSKKTIYQVFPSKTALFNSLMMERLVRLAVPEAESGEPPGAALRAMLLAYGSALLSPRQVTLTRLILANIASVPDANQQVKERCLEAQDRLEAWLARQAERGALRLRDRRAAVETLFALAFGRFLSALLLDCGRRPSEAELAGQIDWGIRVVLQEFAA